MVFLSFLRNVSTGLFTFLSIYIFVYFGTEILLTVFFLGVPIFSEERISGRCFTFFSLSFSLSLCFLYRWIRYAGASETQYIGVLTRFLLQRGRGRQYNTGQGRGLNKYWWGR